MKLTYRMTLKQVIQTVQLQFANNHKIPMEDVEIVVVDLPLEKQP
jgi:hypothetical protein